MTSRKPLIMAFALLFLFGCKKEPVLKISDTIDLIVSEEDTDKVFYIFVENSGNENLKIRNIQTSCKCMSNDFEAMVIPPKNRDSIKLIYINDMKEDSKERIVLYTNTKEKLHFITVNKKIQ